MIPPLLAETSIIGITELCLADGDYCVGKDNRLIDLKLIQLDNRLFAEYYNIESISTMVKSFLYHPVSYSPTTV